MRKQNRLKNHGFSQALPPGCKATLLAPAAGSCLRLMEGATGCQDLRQNIFQFNCFASPRFYQEAAPDTPVPASAPAPAPPVPSRCVSQNYPLGYLKINDEGDKIPGLVPEYFPDQLIGLFAFALAATRG